MEKADAGMMVTHIGRTPIPKKHQPKVARVEHDADGYWIMLARPYMWQGETSFVHENTIAQCLDELRHGVVAVSDEQWRVMVVGT